MNSEILSIVDIISNEKGIKRNDLISAIENGFAKVISEYYGDRYKIIPKMDRVNGEIIFLTDSSYNNSLEKYDDEMYILPNIDIRRSKAFNIKKLILSSIKSIEKQKEYDAFVQLQGKVIDGRIKKVSLMHMIVDIKGFGEAIIFKDKLLKSDIYKVGDLITAYVSLVQRSDNDCQAVLSRVDNFFLSELLFRIVPEMQDGVITVKSVVRDPGSKAKVAVYASDPRLDAVGACIGPRGFRIKSIMNELKGEKIDILFWDRDYLEFAKNAITPAKVVNSSFLEDGGIELVIPDNELKIAIGRSGQNVRLASKLIGANITVISEIDKNTKYIENFNRNVSNLVSMFQIEETIAQLLVSEGFYSPEIISNAEISKLSRIHGFSEDVAEEIKNRAILYLKEEEIKNLKILSDFADANAILSLNGINSKIAVKLCQAGYDSVVKISELSIDDLIEIAPCTDEIASNIILSARGLE